MTPDLVMKVRVGPAHIIASLDAGIVAYCGERFAAGTGPAFVTTRPVKRAICPRCIRAEGAAILARYERRTA